MSNLMGSRYALSLEGSVPQGADHFAIHQSDLDDVAESDDASLAGYVHSYEMGSAVDGPGIRAVVFLSGCLLRCQYCHNPDTWHKTQGHPTTAADLMDELRKYVRPLKLSKGGVTLSGGEPLVQHRFAKRILRRCKELDLHTALDTCGRLGERLTDEELMDIDLNLLDIKSGDEDTYYRVTRQPLQPTLDYAHRLSELGRPTWVRFVLVPGLTDDYDNVERVADIAAGIRSIERVEILRFHQMGKPKWDSLGLAYPLVDTEPPDEALAERVRGQFRARGLTVY
ncbi:pyruvate formate-lyase-activating protein [Niveibacterium sp. SC-1]|uniref:pyruvate formate-lyase-activating protein n=1 Tax=Niveibacterium sp. SC-1 TaxID=3135646 RepID=UPI00311F1359